MPLAEKLSSYVPAAVRDRGREYFRSGAVKLESAGPGFAVAVVYGSEQYDVDLLLHNRTVQATCTCPYVDEHGGVCKHIWATVLAAEPRGFARDSAAAAGRLRLVLVDEVGEDVDATTKMNDDDDIVQFSYRPPTRANPKRETWKDQLDCPQR